MDSIDWSEIHHFETALYSPLFKGIKQKKRYTYPTIGLEINRLSFTMRWPCIAMQKPCRLGHTFDWQKYPRGDGVVVLFSAETLLCLI